MPTRGEQHVAEFARSAGADELATLTIRKPSFWQVTNAFVPDTATALALPLSAHVPSSDGAVGVATLTMASPLLPHAAYTLLDE